MSEFVLITSMSGKIKEVCRKLPLITTYGLAFSLITETVKKNILYILQTIKITRRARVCLNDFSNILLIVYSEYAKNKLVSILNLVRCSHFKVTSKVLNEKHTFHNLCFVSHIYIVKMCSMSLTK